MYKLVLLLLFVVNAPLWAAQCLTPIPNSFNTISEQPQSNKLSTTQQKSMLRLFDAIATSWRGDGQGFMCIGEEFASAYKKYKTYDIELDFNHDTRGVLKARQTSKDNESLREKLASLTLYANKGFLRFDQNSQAGDVWLEAVSSTELNVWSSTRQGNLVSLYQRHLKRTSNTLHVTLREYTNRRLTSEYSAVLKR